MPYRRFKRVYPTRGRRPYARRFGRKTVRRNKLINGGPPGTFAQRLWNSGAPVIKTVGALVRTVAGIRGLINSELHYKDNSLNPAINSTGSVTWVTNSLAQGDQVANRTGNSILLKSVFLRGTANMSSSATTTTMRLIFFLDKENDGATPAVTDVLQTADVKSNYNLLHSKRFVMLYDRLHVFDAVVGPRLKPFKLMLKPPMTHLKFGGTSGNIADARENHIFLLAVSNEATNVPVLPLEARIKWFDN